MIKANFRGVMLGVVSRSYNRRDGQPGVVYDLSVKQAGAVATINCEKSLFDAYTSGVLQDYKEYNFGCTYDDKFRNFRVIDAVPAGKA